MSSRMALVIGFGLLAALAAGAGCVVSPQPSPPDAVLQGDLIGLRPGVELAATVIGFEGGPGAVKPPKGDVIITNLSAADPPSVAPVQPDGSFSIAAPGQPGQTFRFQVKDGAARSLPVDIEVSSSGATATATDQNASCLGVQPAAWLGLSADGDERAITLQNGCGSAVTVAAHLRRNLAGFTISSLPSAGIPAGASVAVTVFAGPGSEDEDVLLLDVGAAESRAVTLTVADR